MGAYKTEPVLKDYLWGGHKLEKMFGRDNGGKKVSESWEISVHKDGESTSGGEKLSSIIARTENFIDKRNSPLPVLIKYIDAAQNLSVQVHPDDAYAREREGDNGKTEMWYILSTEEGAGIYCGFSRNITREEFRMKVREGTVEDCLNFIPVRAGDCYLIEAGTVHAIGAGCVICEIQQNSNVTYRVYDYNRRGADGNLRELHVEKALDVIDFRPFADRTGSTAFGNVAGGRMRLLTRCPYFTCRELILDGTFSAKDENSFTAVNVLEGRGTISGTAFRAGDSFIVPCGDTLSLQGKAKLILTNQAEEI